MSVDIQVKRPRMVDLDDIADLGEITGIDWRPTTQPCSNFTLGYGVGASHTPRLSEVYGRGV